MGKNSKAKRDANRKRPQRARVSARYAAEYDITIFDDLRGSGGYEDPHQVPPAVRDYIYNGGRHQAQLRWAVEHLAQVDGGADTDGRTGTAVAILKELLEESAPGRPMSEAEIEAMQYWTERQCAEFARTVVAYGVDEMFPNAAGEHATIPPVSARLSAVKKHRPAV